MEVRAATRFLVLCPYENKAQEVDAHAQRAPQLHGVWFLFWLKVKPRELPSVWGGIKIT